MSTDPDRDVLRAIARGNRQAITELYDRHARRLLGYLARLTGEAEDAQDLMQELFVIVWRDAARFRGQSSVKTWLFGIAHNLAMTAMRRKRTLPLYEDSPLSDPGAAPDDLAALAIDRERLLQAIQTLSATHRAVIELTFFHGLAQAEIAQVLDCPVGTVKSRLHYALRVLAQVMRHPYEPLS